MKFKKIILLILIIFLTACGSNTTDAIKFKQEYEKYNDKKVKLEISEDNIIKYQTTDEINKIMDSGSAVLFIGDPDDNKSRISIKVLLKAAESTDLQQIYYTTALDKIKKASKINDIKKPIILFVLEGNIISYSMNDKTELNEKEEVALYNEYLDKIHTVLQDTCSEEC